MRNSTKGSYTLEASIFLPFVILAVLSLGYFMRVDGLWENCIHGAIDESSLIASKSYDDVTPATVGSKVKDRVDDDNPELKSLEIRNLRVMYSDFNTDNLTSYRVKAGTSLELPLGFSRDFEMDIGIKYRGYTGKKHGGNPMGSTGLETDTAANPVWVFPRAGEKYHRANCTYVKAAVSPMVLTAAIERRYDICGLCDSGSIPAGSVVFCFEGEDTAYHRSTCSSIVRHPLVMDRSEAGKKGYGACSKCGGG